MKRFAVMLLVIAVFAGCTSQMATRDSATTRAPLPPGIAGSLTSRVVSPAALASINSIAVLPVQGARGVNLDEGTATIMSEEVSNSSSRELQVRTEIVKSRPGGEALLAQGFDAVLVTEVRRFAERRGSNLGGEPGVVDFVMYAESTSTGERLWEAQFHFEDQALSDNLFNLSQRFTGDGAGWKNMQEVTKAGISEALRDLAKRRLTQYGIS